MANDLTPFEGKQVAAVGVEMPNAAGGLQEAMKFDPIEWHHGDEGYIVLHYTTKKVRFDPMVQDQVEPLRRVHVLHVTEAAPIDSEIVVEHLRKHRERVARAKDEAEGKQRIPGIDDTDEPQVAKVHDLPLGARGRAKKTTAKKTTARKSTRQRKPKDATD